MVMVEINSNTILVEPLKSRKDPELTRAYRAMMLQLKRTEITPKKHVLDNEVYLQGNERDHKRILLHENGTSAARISQKKCSRGGDS